MHRSHRRLGACCGCAIGLATLAVALQACRGTTEPALPIGAIAITPPRQYSFWWGMTERCSGKTATFADVRWYTVLGTDLVQVDGRASRGFWFPLSNRIVLAGNSVLSGRLVRHEMLHAISRTTSHRRQQFVEDCDGVVACTDDCAAEAGDPSVPPFNAAEVSAGDMIAAIALDPQAPSIQSDSGWIALSVTVTNPLPQGVWVWLSPVAPGSSSSATFGNIVSCISACDGSTGSEYIFTNDSRFGLPAGATRRFGFDRRLATGTYSARGTFNTDTSAAVVFSLKP